MKLFLSSFTLLCLSYAPPVKAQALTLDQLFWLRSRPEGDNSEYLFEHGWQFGKHITISDSLYYLTSWIFQDAHKKRLAELVYESRGSSNVTSISYSTSNKLTYNAVKTKVTAYHMQYMGQKNVKGAVWNYYRYPDGDYDVSLAVYSNTKTASANWYTVVVKPH